VFDIERMGANIAFAIEHMGANFCSHILPYDFKKKFRLVSIRAAVDGVNVANFIESGVFSPRVRHCIATV
jgi:hypothetical protein